MATDRQGEKFFSKRPDFVAGHHVFIGKQCKPPRSRKGVRIIKRFKATVVGNVPPNYPEKYPSFFQVGNKEQVQANPAS
jgi:hypothetical protein